MSEKIIKVLGLQKSHKENHVLKDASFTIDKGSTFCPAWLKWCWNKFGFCFW